MAVDYSSWLASLPQGLVLTEGWFLLILAASCLFLFFLFIVCENLADRSGWEKIQGCVAFVLIAAWAVGALWLSTRIGVEPQYETFVEKTEQTFGVSHLECETSGGCPTDKLPEDRTPATVGARRQIRQTVDTCGQQQGRSRRPPWDPANE
ncbi:hypothetical protein [Bifidobacterium longum]|uniref:hypothetical protein n=1 Tax=Bifidobacterium longum TaxID=216816 RepID=UPI002024AA3C|nr:hypothetical protein [Bifidobacterium longum]